MNNRSKIITQEDLQQQFDKKYERYKDQKTFWREIVIKNVLFNLPEYYQPIRILGRGAFGVVIVALDNRIPEPPRKKQLVAIKKMTNVFDHKTYAKRTLRQLKLLRLFSHPNIVLMKTLILPKSREQLNQIYVVFEIMDSDLCRVVKKQQIDLNEEHFQFFSYEILKGLKYIHSGNVIHRDLKTKNILIDEKCSIKICDFGSAKPLIDYRKSGILTDYITTRQYRAPELHLGQQNYTTSIDIWALGCILAQLILKEPFLKGQSTIQQLEQVCKLANLEDLQHLSSNHVNLCQRVKKSIIQKTRKKRINFEQKFKECSPSLIDLLKKLLTFDANKRITAQQALQHSFFKEIRSSNQEIKRDPVDPLQFEFQNHDLEIQQLKDLIYEQILIHNFPQFKAQYEARLLKKERRFPEISTSSSSQQIQPNYYHYSCKQEDNKYQKFSQQTEA